MAAASRSGDSFVLNFGAKTFSHTLESKKLSAYQNPKKGLNRMFFHNFGKNDKRSMANKKFFKFLTLLSPNERFPPPRVE